MTIPSEFRGDADAFPPVLRSLLDAELAAGNWIVEAGHNFPAPPAGAYFKLVKPVTTRARESGDGLKFRDFQSSLYSGSFTDERGFYFLLEPPLPPLPEPDMDAIRDAANATSPMTIESDPNTALGRFERSMVIDYEKWHDGIGYDLEALEVATGEERDSIETLLLRRGALDWRDVEALAALGTPRAIDVLKAAADGRDPKIRSAVASYAPNLVPHDKRVASIVKVLETAKLYGGLSEALDEAADLHPKEVVEALFRGALTRDGESAVHFAALLMFIHGKADSPFDWDQRPFFLRFHTENREERSTAFRELCEKIGVDPATFRRAGLS